MTMQLFRFANPDYLYLLLLLPVLITFFIINEFRRRKSLKNLGDSSLVGKLIPEISKTRPVIKFLLELLAFSAVIIMLARPQFGSKIEEVKKTGVEVIIALDVSNSMLAEDIQPNRLTRAKQAISKLVDNLENDKIGLIVFAGDAYTQIPITTDYVSAKMFLSTINPDMVPKQGTAIGAAIDLAAKSFSPGEGKSKAIIIITDGENHEDDPVSSAEKASKMGIIIHTIGIGSTEGVPVPISTGGKHDYLKDADGSTVITKLDEEILKKIAVSANGNYVRASNSNIGLDEIFSDIRKMKKEELESTMYTEYNDQFQIFTVVALFLLILDIVIMERKNRKLQNVKLFKFRI
jgi:Ca-activated chloride channel homolog